MPPAPVIPAAARAEQPSGPPAAQPAGAVLAPPLAGAPGGRLLGDDRQYQPGEAPRAAEAPAAESDAPRKVKLTVARVDPWSAMKLSFLLSVAFAIATVVATVVVWEVLDAMGVFGALNTMLRDVAGQSSGFNLSNYIGLGRVVAIATVVSLVNVVVTMALATLGAVLYNLAGSLVGGLNVTLSDD